MVDHLQSIRSPAPIATASTIASLRKGTDGSRRDAAPLAGRFPTNERPPRLSNLHAIDEPGGGAIGIREEVSWLATLYTGKLVQNR
jgi:hypothetical protein